MSSCRGCGYQHGVVDGLCSGCRATLHWDDTVREHRWSVGLTTDEIEVTILALERARLAGLTAPVRENVSRRVEDRLYTTLRQGRAWARVPDGQVHRDD